MADDLADEDQVVARLVASPVTRQSRYAAARSRIGDPVTALKCGNSANAARPDGRSRDEKKREIGSWCAPRTLTAKTPFRSIVSAPTVPLITQTSTSGGSSETDEKALAVIP